jgi:solute carrier family 35 protein E1
VGNYYYNFFNKLASKEAGGPAGGMTITISVMQIVVCAAYALMLWVVRLNPAPLIGFKPPTKQPLPNISKMDCLTLTPLTVCYAFAHSAGVVALTAGSVRLLAFPEFRKARFLCCFNFDFSQSR